MQPRYPKLKVEAALKKSEEDSVIKPVQFTQWAAPHSLCCKSDGSSHICGDHKVILNRVAKTDTYPFPNIEGLLKDGPG